MATDASDRNENESLKFGGTQPDGIFVKTSTLNSFITEAFDYIALTYVASGSGVGEIQTATYKSGGASGTTVGVLTLTYNASNKIATVTKA